MASRRRLYDWLHLAAPGAVLLAALGLQASGSYAVDWLQNRAFDAFQRLHPRAYEPVPVRVIDIDDESLRRVGQWPWPRTVFARLVDRLCERGAAVIAFDVIFAEEDRTSPSNIARLWRDHALKGELQRVLAKLPENDAVLAAAFKRTRVVTGFTPRDAKSDNLPQALAIVRAASAVSGGKKWDSKSGFNRTASAEPYLPAFPGASPTLLTLERGAAGNGSVGLLPEPDGIVRRLPLLFSIDHVIYPSLAAEALRVAQGARVIKVGVTNTWYGEGIDAVQIGDFTIPTDRQGRAWVHYTEETPDRFVPAWQVLERKAPPEALKGAICFVGTSALGLKDMRATPLNPAAPGVESHAQLAEQTLLDRHLIRPVWAGLAEAAFIAVLGCLLIGLMARLGPGWCAVLGLTAIAGALVGGYRAFTEGSLLLDPIFPSLTVIAVYLVSSLVSHLKTESERRQVRNAFSRYMHPKLVEELARHPEKLRLGGETRPMTVLFCDIRGFTTISEHYDAAGLTHVINRFLTPMTEIIMERSGYIDKYIGDCIMAFWNAPLDDADHAANACSAALSMIAGLGSVNETLKTEAEAEGKKFHELRIGVGLNTGDCCVGNMGSDQRFNYSVLGDDVNLASRLEGQSKAYGVDIIIGPRTRELAPDFAALELDLIKVKGKTRPVRIYTLLGDRALAADAKFRELAESHARMLEAYREQDWDAAQKALKAGTELAETFRLAKLCRLYEDRIEGCRAEPPGKDWDGAYTATSK